jgi:energy-coupling factor transporter transmembrane protein EcfT
MYRRIVLGLLITGIIFILFLKYIQTKDGDTQRAMLSSFVILFIFSLLLNWYMEYIIGWEYGIPGVDLRSFFDAAQALSDGTKITELGPIRFCFEWKLSNVGYILYVVFIYLIVFIPTIISVRFSLQLIYMIQIIVAIIACNNICNFFVKNEIKQKRYIYLIMILNIELCSKVLY